MLEMQVRTLPLPRMKEPERWQETVIQKPLIVGVAYYATGTEKDETIPEV